MFRRLIWTCTTGGRGSLLYASCLIDGDQLNRGEEREWRRHNSVSVLLRMPKAERPGQVAGPRSPRSVAFCWRWPGCCAGSRKPPLGLQWITYGANQTRVVLFALVAIVPVSSGQRPSGHQPPMSPSETSPTGVVSGVPMGERVTKAVKVSRPHPSTKRAHCQRWLGTSSV